VDWRDHGAGGFISLETLLYKGVRTLDPGLQTVPAFVADGAKTSLVSPEALADELSNRTAGALALLAQLQAAAPAGGYPAALGAELNDVETWAALGSYFGLKLKAAVLVQRYRASDGANATLQGQAVSLLQAAATAVSTQAIILG